MAAPEDAGSIYSDVRIRLDKLNADISAVKTGFDKLNTNLKTGSDKTTQGMTKNFDAIKLAGTGAIIGVTVAFKQAIKTFADTEQQLANVRAVSNSTAKDFKALEDAAKSAGVSTRFTASQAADALFSLSSAGLEATESVKALDGVLLLAGATGSGLAESAQAITSTLSQFGLEASKAADVSNIFAAANSNSRATLDKLSNSLRQVGPVAAGLGIGLEETVGSLQALYNAGFQGENAGRALKSALADLANEASPTIKKLDALGVSFSQVDPTVVGLTGAIGALEEAGITTAQVIDVFGKEAGSQLATLIGEGQTALENYTAAVTDTDEAARQYAIQNDTLKGSQDAFKSALEGTSNSLIETLTPAFRAIIDLGTGFLKLINKIPDVLKGVGAGAGTAALGMGILTKAFAVVGVTLGAGPLGIITLLGGVAVGLTTIINKSRETQQAKIADEFGDLARELGYVGTAMDDFIDKIADVESNLEKFGSPDNFESIKDAVKITAEQLGLSVEEVIKIGKESKLVSDEYKDQLTTLQDQITEQQISNQLSSTGALLTEKQLIREQNKLEAQRKQAKLAQEKADREKAELDRAVRLKEIQSEALLLDELQRKGAISEQDLLDEKIKLRQEEIDLLLLQSITSGKVSDQTVKDIKAQEAQILRYQKRLDELNEQEKEDGEEKKSVYKSTSNTYENTLKDSEFAHGSFTVKSKELNEEETMSWQESSKAIFDVVSNLYNTLVNAKVDAANAEIAEIERITANEISNVDARTEALLTAQGLQEETKLESLQRQLDAVNGVTQSEEELLDLATQKKLEDLGLLEDTKLQSLQKQLDDAILKGDLELQNELEKEIARTKILEDAAAEKDRIEKERTAKELEDEIARTKILQDAADEKERIEKAAAEKTANLKYDADVASWQASKFNTGVAGAQAAIEAYKALAGIPVVGPALGIAAAAAVGTATIKQISVINKNKPKKQTFATGGIVLPESGVSSTGDKINVGVNPREMILTEQQQATLFKIANGGGNTGDTMIQLYMDSKVVAQGVARNFNNGVVKVTLK